MPCSKPVVFLIFCRPDVTARTLNLIRDAQPNMLLVIADGPRNEEEAILCRKTRSVIDQVDWECEVRMNYSDINLGCRDRVSSGLHWVFEQVDEAIILEDDCLPNSSFFYYCENLLNYYRHDERVMVISGDNFQDGQQRTKYSYYFSKYNHCWGWATWRRAWRHWDFNPEKWKEFRDSNFLQFICDDPYETKYWTAIFDTLFLKGKPDSWAYVWLFSCWAQGGLTILPNVNLVSNIGFGVNATHTTEESRFANMPTDYIGKIYHPPFIVQHKAADKYTFDYFLGGQSLRKTHNILGKIRSRIIKTLKILSQSDVT